MHTYIKFFSILLISISLASCGGESTITSQQKAIQTIANYTKNTQSTPTVKDYEEAGITGVNEKNLAQVNAIIKQKKYQDVDSKEELQAIVENLNIACAQVITHAYNPTTGEEKDFATPCDVSKGWIIGKPPSKPEKPKITVSKTDYSPNETLSVSITGKLSGDKDWAGIYHKGANNNWKNVIAWNWVRTGKNQLTKDKKSMPAGDYEVRLFFHNKFELKAKNQFTVKTVISNKQYGKLGKHKTSQKTAKDGKSFWLYPTDISKNKPTPVVLFSPGWGSQNPNNYKTLLEFIVSHGYSVIFVKDVKASTAGYDIERFESMLTAENNILPYLDTSRIGVLGHSSGGGDAFSILSHFSKKGYGENGRFIMALDPWFAFDMTSKSMRNLPSNTNAVILRFYKDGKNGTDSRIVLSEYALLESIPTDHKDYQIFSPATHGYANGNKAIEQMQGVLKPLDALMAYTFKNDMDAHDIALEVGSDTPFGDGLETVKPLWKYNERCNSHKNTAEVYDIDYCNQYLGSKKYPKSEIGLTDKVQADVPKPAYLESYIDPVFHTKVTRITDRIQQSGNAHSYPKTQSWNADMSLIRLGYRIYNADDYSESLITKNSLIRGSISEIKWSTWQANVFYGMDRRNNSFIFTKATINRQNNTIDYKPLITFSGDEYDELLLGKYEANLDFQSQYVVFSGRKKNTNQVTLITFQLQDLYGHKDINKIIAEKTLALKWYKEDNNGNFDPNISGNENQMFDWASMSALGNYVIVNYRSKLGNQEQEYSLEQYDKKLNHIRRLAEHGNHGDLGLDVNGNEIYVQFGFGLLNGQSLNGIWMYPLDGSPRTQLLPDKYNGGHVSCRNYKRPGWCYVNTRYLWKGKGVREVFALKLDDTKTVQRFAQTHISAHSSLVGPSPDGTKVLFLSNWGDSNIPSDDWDTFVVETE